jgi:hypothetical protein
VKVTITGLAPSDSDEAEMTREEINIALASGRHGFIEYDVETLFGTVHVLRPLVTIASIAYAKEIPSP